MSGKAKKRVSSRDGALLEACKKAYRKHVMQDDNVGWEELSDLLGNVLTSAMGDRKFNEWVDSVGREKPIV